MEMIEITKIVHAFLGWMLTILNALGITAFNESLSNAMGKLEW